MERRAGFIIENKCREVLLVLGRYANKWSFPKGHTEPGETELACAERELREETGRTLEGTEEDLGVGTFSRTCTYFLRRTNEMDLFSSGRRDKREIKRIKWFNKEELLGLAREEVNRDVHSYILSIADTEQ
jgi:8-oxo-dGTP pyrophosphatase MutT (NUDIX family)